MQKISTELISFQRIRMCDQSKGQKVLETIPFEGKKKMRKGERLQQVELQSICAVMSKFMDAEIQIQKNMQKIPTKPINSNEWQKA